MSHYPQYTSPDHRVRKEIVGEKFERLFMAINNQLCGEPIELSESFTLACINGYDVVRKESRLFDTHTASC